jgi:hypothetical protein
LVEGPQEVA